MNQNTEIIFCIKDEPVIHSIAKEFKNENYTMTTDAKGRFTIVKLNINKIIPVFDGEFVKLDGWDTQFESIKYY